MAKTIFEQMGGTYTQVGDFLIPNLKLPAEETQANIGVWGMRHKRFLKELAEKENVTEELKATDQMLWVQKMNNIRNRATEIVNAEIIFTV